MEDVYSELLIQWTNIDQTEDDRLHWEAVTELFAKNIHQLNRLVNLGYLQEFRHCCSSAQVS